MDHMVSSEVPAPVIHSWSPLFSGDLLVPNRRDLVVYRQIEFESLIEYERRRSRRTGEQSTLLLCAFDDEAVSERRQRRLVQALHRAVRETDHIGRYGSKYLGVILSGTDVDDAAGVCAKLCQVSAQLAPRNLELLPL